MRLHPVVLFGGGLFSQTPQARPSYLFAQGCENGPKPRLCSLSSAGRVAGVECQHGGVGFGLRRAARLSLVGKDRGPTTRLRRIFFAAVQRQLGLWLDAGRGPVEVLVIDQVARPSSTPA
jgi:hypothetical protein